MPVLYNARQELFAQGLARGLTQAEAYIRAGYKAGNANAIMASASKLLRNAKVAARVAEIQAVGAAIAEVSAAQVMKELARIGFSDLRKAVRWTNNLVTIKDDGEVDADGRVIVKQMVTNQVILTPSADLDDATAAAIAEVVQTKDGLRVKLHDKKAALDSLAKALGLFRDEDPERKDPDFVPLHERIKEYARAAAIEAAGDKVVEIGKPHDPAR